MSLRLPPTLLCICYASLASFGSLSELTDSPFLVHGLISLCCYSFVLWTKTEILLRSTQHNMHPYFHVSVQDLQQHGRRARKYLGSSFCPAGSGGWLGFARPAAPLQPFASLPVTEIRSSEASPHSEVIHSYVTFFFWMFAWHLHSVFVSGVARNQVTPAIQSVLSPFATLTLISISHLPCLTYIYIYIYVSECVCV